MISLEGVRASSLPRGASAGASFQALSLHLAAGNHAVIGAPPETALLLDLVAGRALARGGRVLVDGRSPTDGRARAVVSYVPLELVLPEVLRVSEVAHIEAELRGARAGLSPEVRLATLDLAGLAGTRISDLRPEEVRAVALALALTSGARVVLIEEPFVSMDARVVARLAPAAQTVASHGVCVLSVTTSARDAGAIGAEVHVLENERLSPRLVHEGRGAEGGAILRVSLGEPIKLASRIAGDPAITDVRTSAHGVEVRGQDLDAIASAVARAAVHGDLSIVSMSASASPSLEGVAR